jgi:spermidine/putrescine transport system ATP-binding protein
VAGGIAVLQVGQERLSALADLGLTPGQKVTLTIRPEKLQLARPNESTGDNALTGMVREVVYIGTDTRYVVALPRAGDEALVARIQNVGGRGVGEFAAGDAVKIWCAPEDARTLMG